jgi:hypothetical protein
MNSTSSRAPWPWLGALFAVVVLLSAFLLFQVQPLISKFILPWFGGSPNVWTTCVLFFQVALFAGYAYAHVVATVRPPLVPLLVHLVLLAAATALLPIVPDPSWRPTEAGDPTLRILALLGTCVGVPYLALASTGPLVQSWFSRTFPGKSPYRLYALSNVGSLTALLSYPFLVEPALAVGRQAVMWSWGFAAFAVLCASCAWMAWRRSGPAESGAEEVAGRAPGLRDWLAWLSLPALASLGLLATTNHVCQDVAVIPFLWVVPLALYLLSFIIAFDHERWYVRPAFAGLVVVSTVLLASLDLFPVWMSFDKELVLYFVGLFALCMVCHGELVRHRPAPRYLTSFYLAIAAGGSLGGIFVTLVAPRIFSTYREWPITLVLGYLLALGLLWRVARERHALKGAVVVVGLAGLVVMGRGLGWFSEGTVEGRLTARYNRGYECKVLARLRSFFGVNTVLERYQPEDPALSDRVIYNGQVPHGLQLTDPARTRWPTAYYRPESGVARAITWFSDKGETRVGVIGLGVGTIASYARSGDFYRFYEINPDVELLARRYFRFLEECPGDVGVVLGDARIALEREEARPYHVLVLDAFSGDAIPVHLLTKEAMEVYRRHLAPDGIIAIHISNAYLDLAPVVRGLAADAGLRTLRIWTPGDDSRSFYKADWMLVTNNEGFLKEYAAIEDEDPDPRRSVLWTDTESNLFEVLR